MNEIDKLYEYAGFQKKQCKDYSCTVCDKYNKCEKYPPFTAEKQLNLIKLLTQQCDLIISHFKKWEFIHFDGENSTQIRGKNFDEALAGLINNLWQVLTVKEKQQIKEILEWIELK